MEKIIEQIREFNELAGNLNMPVSKKLEAAMLREEIREYLDAKTPVDLKDAIGDIFFVLMGTIQKHNLEEEFEAIMSEICASNLSKFCSTYEEAMSTIDKYQQKGIKCVYKYNGEYDKFVIKSLQGKVLKGINYFKPNL